MELVERLNQIATNGLQPDITFYFDIEPKLGLARKAVGIQGEMDRMEQERISFHRLVRRGYQQLAKKYPNRIKVIPVATTSSPKEIFRLLENEINQLV
jgi:dTMP kinase